MCHNALRRIQQLAAIVSLRLSSTGQQIYSHPLPSLFPADRRNFGSMINWRGILRKTNSSRPSSQKSSGNMTFGMVSVSSWTKEKHD